MSEQKTPAHWPPDRELNTKAVVATGLALLIATALSGALVWWVAGVLTSRLDAQDPPPPVLLEARTPYEPPTPRLQTNPAELLEALRAEEDEILGTYGWVDTNTEIVRVPIERGMELLLETRADGRAFGSEQAQGDTE